MNPAGQDDNLGDSILRVGLLEALRGDASQLHVHLEAQSSDYLAGIPLKTSDAFYTSRREWLKASRQENGSVFVLNAGEISPKAVTGFPHPRRVGELRGVLNAGGRVIAAGMGLKAPSDVADVKFDASMRDASVVSWRDHKSRDAAGFGGVAPDWAFSLGTPTEQWAGRDNRSLLAVTLRFDRPWPGEAWLELVQQFARREDLRIVTVAQVARDAPLAVRLAEALGGEYLIPPSMAHDALEAYVRAVYGRSVAVVSDRAHALIMGASEGAYPIGSAVDPQKIERLLTAAGVGCLTGDHVTFGERIQGFGTHVGSLAAGIHAARVDLSRLTEEIQRVIHG